MWMSRNETGTSSFCVMSTPQASNGKTRRNFIQITRTAVVAYVYLLAVPEIFTSKQSCVIHKFFVTNLLSCKLMAIDLLNLLKILSKHSENIFPWRKNNFPDEFFSSLWDSAHHRNSLFFIFGNEIRKGQPSESFCVPNSSILTTAFVGCVPEKRCCSTNNYKSIWDSYYTWFGFGVLFFIFLTTVIIYLANACKRKQQNLIRIRNLSDDSDEHNIISTVTGPGGIIQPDIRRLSNITKSETSTVVPITDSSITDGQIKAYAKPLTPPYPPVEPVAIIKGSAPAEGYRQTESYTDIVLPPGFIDVDHYKT